MAPLGGDVILSHTETAPEPKSFVEAVLKAAPKSVKKEVRKSRPVIAPPVVVARRSKGGICDPSPPAGEVSLAEKISRVLPQVPAHPFPQRFQHFASGKTILFVCCGHGGIDSKRFVFERVKSWGATIVLVEDESNSLAREMLADKVINELVTVDMTPRLTLLRDVLRALELLMERRGVRFDACTTFWDDAVTLTARICARLQLPGHPVTSVDTAHDKHLTRRVLEEIGLPTPRHFLIKSEKDLVKASHHVGFPAVIKPTYGASSLAVLEVATEADLLPTYHKTLKLLEEFYMEGELMGITFEDDNDDCSPHEGLRGNASLLWVVLEEYLDGPEVDVDIVMRNKKVLYKCVVDDWPQIQPWFAEMGNNCPSVLPESSQEKLAVMAEQCVRAMQFTDGVFHTELKLTSRNGPRLIEVNPRMGGGPVWSLHINANQVDLIEQEIAAALRVPIDLAKIKTVQNVSCGEKFYQKSCVIREEFCQAVRALAKFPNVLEATPLLAPGERVVGIDDGFPTRTARFVITGPTPVAAEAYARHLLTILDSPLFVK